MPEWPVKCSRCGDLFNCLVIFHFSAYVQVHTFQQVYGIATDAIGKGTGGGDTCSDKARKEGKN